MQPYSAPKFGSTLPQGSRCATHAGRDAVVSCSRCGDYCCVDCYQVARNGLDLCVRCDQHLSAPLASPGSRLMAQLINGAIVSIVCFVPLLCIVMLSDYDSRPNENLVVMLATLGVLVACTVWVGVNLFYLHREGQSVGKKIMGIRIVRTSGEPADIGRLLFLRYLVPAFIGQLCGVFSLVDALMVFSADRRCIHDHMADTIVVECQTPRTF